MKSISYAGLTFGEANNQAADSRESAAALATLQHKVFELASSAVHSEECHIAGPRPKYSRKIADVADTSCTAILVDKL